MRRLLSFGAVLAALGLLAAVCARRREDLEAALDAVPLGAFALLVALHLATLVCRSEAWRLTLHAVDGHWLARDAVHGANAAAFVAGSLESHTAMPARIALLGRLAGSRAPRPGQIAVADVPIFLLEVCGTAVLLAAAGPWPWWSAPLVLSVAAGALLGGRHVLARYGERAPLARGLAVLEDTRLRVQLLGFVVAITLLGAARVLVALWACGLDHGPGEVAVVFAALGVFGLLPLGPSASPGATLAVAGGAGGLAAGLCISASSIAAVLAYAVVVASLTAGNRAKHRLQAIRLERPEAVELRVIGTVEVRRAGGEQAELARAGVE